MSANNNKRSAQVLSKKIIIKNNEMGSQVRLATFPL